MGLGTEIVKGGAQGATAGSAGGPWGALLGLGLGGAFGAASSLLQKPEKQKQISNIRPEQLGWKNQAGALAMQGLQNPYEGFEPIANKAREEFETYGIPSIANRFTAMPGGQRSSAFQGALGQARAGLDSNLAALRSQYGLQNRQLSGNLLSQALTPDFDTRFSQHEPGFLENALGGLAGPFAKYGANELGMYMGAYDQPKNKGQGNQAAGSFGGQDIGPMLQQLLQYLQGGR